MATPTTLEGYYKARDVILAAFRLVRGAKSEEPVTRMDLENAWQSLTMMLDGWSAESLMIPSVVRETFSTVSNQAAYTWGASGDWNSSRPILIRDIRVLFGGIDVPVAIVGYDDYQNVKLKTLAVSPPQMVYPDYAYPLLTLRFYPVPASVMTVTTIADKPLSDLLSYSDAVLYPPGYLDALVYNLAIRLAAEYGATLAQQVPVMAAIAKRQVKSNNARQTTLEVDAALRAAGGRGRYNVYSDQRA